MAFLNVVERFSPTTLIFAFGLSVVFWFVVQRVIFDDVPGPLICRLTSLWTYYHSYIGDECTQIDKLHKSYGTVVRIAPNEISISDGAALNPIYSEKGGFLKAPCYTNFDIEGHKTIFSALDPAHRAVRSKAVVPLFSMGNVRAGGDVIEGCVSKFVVRMKEAAEDSRKRMSETGKMKPVNILNLARSLALDAVSSYLFGSDFDGISEKGERMSASSFFFLPNWAFIILETLQQKLWPNTEEAESASKVGKFVGNFVENSEKDDLTYQGRLMKTGISTPEIEVQCKDLIFAGTDSTGMNISTICWHLAKQPQIYTKLREEIAEADAKNPSYYPQNLPYLDAVIREGLRISMANPTRLPRLVPAQGFTFSSNGKQFHLPAGTQVGLQIYTLHFNPTIFPDPFAFNPDRWLPSPTPEMQRDFIPFGLGQRQCIARNLATHESFLAVRALAREGVLEGAVPVGDRIEILEWFNSKVKNHRIDLVWT